MIIEQIHLSGESLVGVAVVYTSTLEEEDNKLWVTLSLCGNNVVSCVTKSHVSWKSTVRSC